MTVRRYLVLAPGHFADDAKTAHGVIRYGRDEIAAVVDPSCAGRSVREVVPYLDCDAPVVASVAEGLAQHPTALLIGTAPVGGALPQAWRRSVLDAIAARLEIVSGLHEMLGDDAEFAEAAKRSGVRITDLRKPPPTPVFTGAAYGVTAPVLLAVGNDCQVGKMTVVLELARAAARANVRAEFVPTGQTGIAIAGWGIAIDRVVSDFASGASEQLVCEAAQRGPDLIFVEGQGAINHPAYAPVTLALMYGCAPDALLLVCDPVREKLEGFEARTMGYRELIRLHEAILAPVKPAAVVGIALRTRGLDDAAAQAEIERARAETLLPADDVVRNGPDLLFGQIRPALVKRQPAHAPVTA